MESPTFDNIKALFTLKNIGEWLHNYRVALLVFVIALVVTFPYNISIEVDDYATSGVVSQATVIAPFKFDVLRSDEELEAARREVEMRSFPIFRYDSTARGVVEQRIKTLTALFAALGDTTTSDSLRTAYQSILAKDFSVEDYEAIVANIRMLSAVNRKIYQLLDKGVLNYYVATTPEAQQAIQREYHGAVLTLLENSPFVLTIKDSSETPVFLDSLFNLPRVYEEVNKLLPEELENRRRLSSAFFHYTKGVVVPNYLYDRGETLRRLKIEVAKIKKVKQTILKDVEIVRAHQVVTPEIAEILDALHREQVLRSSQSALSQIVTRVIVSFLLIIFVVVVLTLYLVNYIPPRLTSSEFFRAFSIIIAIQFMIIRGSQWFVNSAPFIQFNEAVNSHDLAYGAIPLVVAPLLASILFNRQSGLFMAVFLSVYVGITTDFNLINSIGALITGAFAAYIAHTLRYRNEFVWLVIWLIVINIASDLLAAIGGYGFSAIPIGQVLMYAIIDAFISVLVVILLLPVIEHFFSLTTNMKLLELADMNHPLLKELAISAPGTYNHSIMVANLAEAGAAAIGADALLCRVASYYHDIGKAKKPLSFIENQRFKKNVHDKMSASRSARVISGHVTDGVAMADEYHLPPAIKDAIQQHHGDALISFFYEKALQEKKENETIEKRDFCYSGPKPQSKEMAIIMIADSVEAVSRTLKSATTKELRELVVKISRKKIDANQLDECTLTFNELSEIANGMLKVLNGAFHSRIEYPEEQPSDEDHDTHEGQESGATE